MNNFGTFKELYKIADELEQMTRAPRTGLKTKCKEKILEKAKAIKDIADGIGDEGRIMVQSNFAVGEGRVRDHTPFQPVIGAIGDVKYPDCEVPEQCSSMDCNQCRSAEPLKSE